MNIMAGMIVFTLIGYAIDLRLESFYIATLLGIGVGLFYCFYEIWKLTKIEQ
ncbi:MAG: AtpZ/AtpI family protein [Candidatus Omnitrophota bacterium]|nr:AtpZ/AtpI family protein [Candidatus Omnitrophota bacterium]